jgi:hypothetical protein
MPASTLLEDNEETIEGARGPRKSLRLRQAQLAGEWTAMGLSGDRVCAVCVCVT